MPALTPLALTRWSDEAPLSFNPEGIDANGVASFVVNTGTPIGDPRVTASKTRTSTGRQKVTIKMAVPVIQNVVVNGVSNPTVVRTAYADLTFTFAETSNTAERNDLRHFIYDVLGSAEIGVGMLDNLGSLY
jgi:hypothetical protein